MEWKYWITDQFVHWDAQSILTSAEFDYVSELCCTEEILRGHGAAREASLTVSSNGPLLLQEAQIGEGNVHSLLVQIPRAKAVIICARDQLDIGWLQLCSQRVELSTSLNQTVHYPAAMFVQVAK